MASRFLISLFCWIRSSDGHLLHVQDLAAERQHGLGLAVPRHLGGTARRVAFHDKELGILHLVRGTVREFARQVELERRELPRHVVLGGPRCHTRLGGEQHTLHHGVGHGRVCKQIRFTGVLDRGLDGRGDLGVVQLLLGLALELGIFYEHAHDAVEPFVHILGRDGLDVLGDKVLALGIGAHRLGEARPDRHLMGAAVGGVDRVGVGMDLHVRGNGPVHRALDLEVVLLLEIEGLGIDYRRSGNDALDIVLDPVVVLEGDRLLPVAEVLDRDLEPLVQEGLALGYVEDVLVIESWSSRRSRDPGRK